MKPGTYRIVNLASGTAITETEDGTVGWHIVDEQRQLWFAQESGEGYRFKNVASGGYLAVASTVDYNSELRCSGYPTTWMLIPNPDYTSCNTYGIMMGGTDRILDLSNWGSNADKTKIYAFEHPKFMSPKHRVWKFERINDETGEEIPSLSQAQEALTRAEQTIKSQEVEIEFLRQLIVDARQTRVEDQPEFMHMKQEVARLTSQVENSEHLLAEIRYSHPSPDNMG